MSYGFYLSEIVFVATFCRMGPACSQAPAGWHLSALPPPTSVATPPWSRQCDLGPQNPPPDQGRLGNDGWMMGEHRLYMGNCMEFSIALFEKIGENLQKNTKSWFQISAADVDDGIGVRIVTPHRDRLRLPVEGSSLCTMQKLSWNQRLRSRAWLKNGQLMMDPPKWMLSRFKWFNILKYLETYWNIPILHNFDPQLFLNSVPKPIPQDPQGSVGASSMAGCLSAHPGPTPRLSNTAALFKVDRNSESEAWNLMFLYWTSWQDMSKPISEATSIITLLTSSKICAFRVLLLASHALLFI